MTPFPRRFSVFNLSQVPLILVGQALENCHSVAPIKYSGLNGRPYQLWKVKIKVEQVIQGEIPSKELEVFYFIDWSPGSRAWSRLVDIYQGHSEVFFLQSDGNHWRAIDDGWRSCVLWVRTGTHYNYKVDSNLPIQDIFINIILSRGDHTSDQQMIDAIYHPDGRWGWAPVINNLQKLAEKDSSSQVRAIALRELLKYQKAFGKGDRIVPHDVP